MITVNSMSELQTLIVGGFDEWGLLGDVTVKYQDDLMLFSYARIHSMKWNWFERVSRGLILQQKTGKVIARPFDKFYNWLEGGRRCAKDAHLVQTTEKLDGSLGILYHYDGKWNCASRGSFDGMHAQWGQHYLKERQPFERHLPGEEFHRYTFIVEMIWPENKIVIDYGDERSMRLVGVRCRETGEHLPFFHWTKDNEPYRLNTDIYGLAITLHMKVPGSYGFNGVLDVLEKREQLGDNEEGYVCEFSDGTRFKFKGDRYKEMHRLVTGQSYKRIIKMMSEGVDIPEGYAISERAAFVRSHVLEIQNQVEQAYALAPKSTRKEYALWIKHNHPSLLPYMFARLDGQDYEPIIYRQAFK